MLRCGRGQRPICIAEHRGVTHKSRFGQRHIQSGQKHCQSWLSARKVFGFTNGKQTSFSDIKHQEMAKIP